MTRSTAAHVAWIVAPPAAVGALVVARVVAGPPPDAALGALLVLATIVHAAAALRHARHREEPRLLPPVLWSVSLLGLLWFAGACGLLGAVLVPVGLACVVAGLGIHDAGRVRDLAGRALRRRLPDDDAATAWRRDVAGLRLLVPILAVALLVAPVALWRVEWGSDAAERAPVRPPALPAPAEDAPGGEDVALAVPSEVPAAQAPASDDPWLMRRILLEVRATRDGAPAGDLGPVYLRGPVFPVLGADGGWTADASLARRRADADDGAADGWCDVAPRPAAAPLLRFDVTQHVKGTTLAPLFAGPGLVAVRGGEARFEPDGVLLAPDGATTPIEYALLGRAPTSLPYPTDRTHAAYGDARTLGLPDRPPPAVALLAAEAAQVTTGVSTDLAKVRAIVRHLREGCTYQPLEDADTGLGALDRFVAERRGTCVQFAEAAAVMARSAGLPSRVVHGFLARRFDPVAGAYTARGRDYHAWTEVAFEGCGWVVFDATPDAATDADAERPAPPQEAAADGPAGADGEAEDDGSLAAYLDALRDAHASLRETAAGHPWVTALLLVASAAAVAIALRRRSERIAGRRAAGAEPAASAAWARLLHALARRGHRRCPSQTATEFAAEVVAIDPRLGAFVALTARQQEARFGGRPLTADEERDADRLRASLRG